MGYKFFNDPCLRQLTIYDLQRSDKTISGIFYTSEENISGRIFSKGNAGTEGGLLTDWPESDLFGWDVVYSLDCVIMIYGSAAVAHNEVNIKPWVTIHMSDSL